MANGCDTLQAPAGDEPAGVVLPRALLITDVRSCAEGLRAAVARGGVTVDASRLADIDTAGLQLLCATRATALASGKAFRWSADSAGLRAAAAATGLGAALGLDP
ncbi:MAG: STAS domain-containing protein [Steroidobacteraceae bacterium]|jgi:anti-anti-sigma regulatory factor|nr:STAS domain-containing protein [Steroidobacteraceae bacterium]